MAVIRNKKALITSLPLQLFDGCTLDISIIDINVAKSLNYDYYFVSGSVVEALNSKGFSVDYNTHLICNFSECNELYYLHFDNTGNLSCVKILVN